MSDQHEFFGIDLGEVHLTPGIGWSSDPPPQIHHSARVGGAPESRDFEGEPQEMDIEPGVRIGPFATVDAGCIRETTIGRRTWIMAKAHVGHDTMIGWDCEVSTGAIIGGGCWIGDDVRIGIGAVILPRQVIGDGARIGAGAVVTKDVLPGQVVVGNPARPLR